MKTTNYPYDQMGFKPKNMPGGEPCFFMRAQDVLTVPILIAYKVHAQRFGCSPEFIDEIQERIDAFSSWQLEHPTKVPD